MFLIFKLFAVFKPIHGEFKKCSWIQKNSHIQKIFTNSNIVDEFQKNADSKTVHGLKNNKKRKEKNKK